MNFEERSGSKIKSLKVSIKQLLGGSKPTLLKHFEKSCLLGLILKYVADLSTLLPYGLEIKLSKAENFQMSF